MKKTIVNYYMSNLDQILGLQEAFVEINLIGFKRESPGLNDLGRNISNTKFMNFFFLIREDGAILTDDTVRISSGDDIILSRKRGTNKNNILNILTKREQMGYDTYYLIDGDDDKICQGFSTLLTRYGNIPISKGPRTGFQGIYYNNVLGLLNNLLNTPEEVSIIGFPDIARPYISLNTISTLLGDKKVFIINNTIDVEQQGEGVSIIQPPANDEDILFL